MDNLALTIIAAIILMALVILGLAIGLLVTGKSRLRRGCGWSPSSGKKKKDDTHTCSICGEEKTCKEKDNEHGTSDSKK